MFGIGVGVGSTAPRSSTSSSASSAVAAAPTADRRQQLQEDRKAPPGLWRPKSDADLIGLAQKVCDTIGTQGMTREILVGGLSTSKLGPTVAPVLIDTAHGSYCPEKSWGASGPAAAPAPAPAAAPASGGPLTEVSEGTYEVGTGDGQVAPGKYKSPGPSGSGGSCYWARLRSDDTTDIIANDLKEGPTVMTVKAADKDVEVRGCTFTKS